MTRKTNAVRKAKPPSDHEKLMHIGNNAFACIAEMTRPLRERLKEVQVGKRPPVLVEDEVALRRGRVLRDADTLEEDARREVTEDALSIELTGTWSLGSDPSADAYIILLSTGGPAVRIVGELDTYGEPRSARLEAQDWFLPWTEYPCDEDVLMSYVSCFPIQGDT